MWIHWPFFPKTWTKGHWPPRWPLTPMSVEVTCVTLPKDHCVQVPWEYINVCGYSNQFCKLPHTYTYYVLRTYYVHTTYRMSDHMVSYWTQFRRDKKLVGTKWTWNLWQTLHETLVLAGSTNEHTSRSLPCPWTKLKASLCKRLKISICFK